VTFGITALATLVDGRESQHMDDVSTVSLTILTMLVVSLAKTERESSHIIGVSCIHELP
jgi:hypothetical protein